MQKKKPKKRGRPSGWTPDRIALLRKHYPLKSNEEVAAILKTGVISVRNAAVKYHVKKDTFFWDKSEETFLLDNWPVLTAEKIAAKLGRTRYAIINKYRALTGLRDL